MPSVYFQKSRFCWACSWKQSGKTLVKYFKSKAEAVAFKPTARPSAISAPVVSDFSTIITQYLGTLKVRERTLVRYQQEIASLRMCMKSLETSRDNIMRIIEDIQCRYTAAKSSRALKRLKVLCKFAEIPFPPNVRTAYKHKKGTALSEQQVQELLHRTQKDYPNYYLLLCILLDTGARLGEVLALNWEDWDGESIKICKSYAPNNKGPKITPVKTSRSNRVLPLSAPLNRLLNDFKGLPREPLCKSLHGSRLHPSNLRRDWWKKVCGGYRIHDLRHTCATFLLNQVDPRVVSAKLGHESTTTTLKIYDHLLHQKKNLPSLLYKIGS